MTWFKRRPRCRCNEPALSLAQQYAVRFIVREELAKLTRAVVKAASEAVQHNPPPPPEDRGAIGW